MTKKSNITILKVRVKTWIIPMYGNNHIMPYGTLFVETKDEKGMCNFITVKTKGDTIYDKVGYQYVTINRQRYKVMVESSMWNPIVKLRPMQKKRINGKLCWVD